jgi:hypothetical protein
MFNQLKNQTVMIKFIPHFILFAFLSAFHAGAQDVVPNHSFENWSDLQPDEWTSFLNTDDFQNVFQSDDAYAGLWSAELKVLYNETYMFAPPAQIFSDIFAVTQQHEALNGYFKGSAEGSDSLQVAIIMLSESQPIGVGIFSTGAAVSNWTAFSAPITYFTKSIPDQASITIIAGASETSTEGTIYSIDNLSFGEWAGVNDLRQAESVSLYPNPANEQVAVSFTLDDNDRMNLELITTTGERAEIAVDLFFGNGMNTYAMDVSHLAPGIYFLSAQGEKYRFIQKVVISR